MTHVINSFPEPVTCTEIADAENELPGWMLIGSPLRKQGSV
jgi:hypothetical protein